MPRQGASLVPLESTAKQLVLLLSLNARVASRVIMAWDLESPLWMTAARDAHRELGQLIPASAPSPAATHARKVVTMRTPRKSSARNARPARPVLLKELLPVMLAIIAIVVNTLLSMAHLIALIVSLDITLILMEHTLTANLAQLGITLILMANRTATHALLVKLTLTAQQQDAQHAVKANIQTTPILCALIALRANTLRVGYQHALNALKAQALIMPPDLDFAVTAVLTFMPKAQPTLFVPPVQTEHIPMERQNRVAADLARLVSMVMLPVAMTAQLAHTLLLVSLNAPTARLVHAARLVHPKHAALVLIQFQAKVAAQMDHATSVPRVPFPHRAALIAAIIALLGHTPTRKALLFANLAQPGITPMLPLITANLAPPAHTLLLKGPRPALPLLFPLAPCAPLESSQQALDLLNAHFAWLASTNPMKIRVVASIAIAAISLPRMVKRLALLAPKGFSLLLTSSHQSSSARLALRAPLMLTLAKPYAHCVLLVNGAMCLPLAPTLALFAQLAHTTTGKVSPLILALLAQLANTRMRGHLEVLRTLIASLALLANGRTPLLSPLLT